MGGRSRSLRAIALQRAGANYPGRSVVPHWAKSGAGELKSSSLMFGRSQQKP